MYAITIIGTGFVQQFIEHDTRIAQAMIKHLIAHELTDGYVVYVVYTI